MFQWDSTMHMEAKICKVIRRDQMARLHSTLGKGSSQPRRNVSIIGVSLQRLMSQVYTSGRNCWDGIQPVFTRWCRKCLLSANNSHQQWSRTALLHLLPNSWYCRTFSILVILTGFLMVRNCDSNLRSMIINEIAPFFIYLFIIYISTFVKHPFNNSLANCSIIIFSLVIHGHSFCFQFYGGIVDLLCVNFFCTATWLDYTYVFFFTFFSIMVFHRILSTFPYAIQ